MALNGLKVLSEILTLIRTCVCVGGGGKVLSEGHHIILNMYKTLQVNCKEFFKAI